MIQIVTGDPRPVFRQIVDEVRRKIASGELAAGARLPSVRALAMQLTVNPNTVAKAYAELTAEGLAEARRGVGLFVLEPSRDRLSVAERQRRLDEAMRQFVDSIVGLDFDIDEILARLEAELAPFTPSASGRRRPLT
ncbi:MAG: GntR family transcriptional regulator [Acidobacteriota bacterium]